MGTSPVRSSLRTPQLALSTVVPNTVTKTAPGEPAVETRSKGQSNPTHYESPAPSPSSGRSWALLLGPAPSPHDASPRAAVIIKFGGLTPPAAGGESADSSRVWPYPHSKHNYIGCVRLRAHAPQVSAVAGFATAHKN